MVRDGRSAFGEALGIGIEHTRLRFADVAFFNLLMTECSVGVRARDPIIDQNEPSPLRKSVRAGEHRIGAHRDLHL
jgi:hypothetical protein